MENIIIILGPKTEEMHMILDGYYANSVTVEASFKTINDFYRVYNEKVMKVDRIVIMESAFSHDTYAELTDLKEVLNTFYASFNEVFMLTSTNKDTIEIISMLKGEMGEKGERVKIYDNEGYNPRMIIEYCLGNVTKRHHTKGKTEYEEIIRVKRNSENTFQVETEDGPSEDTEVVVLGNKNTSLAELEERRKSLIALAQTSKDLTWEGSPILKDITRINELVELSSNLQRYEIDYSYYFLSDKVKEVDNNIVIVTGEKRSGKSMMSLAIATSASDAGKKVLLIDSDLMSLGLSDLCERSNLNMTPMLLQSFLRFSDSIKTIVKARGNLHAVLVNSDSKFQLEGLEASSLINMIASCASKYYDLVVVDTPLPEIANSKPLFKNCFKTVYTVPATVTSILSSYKSYKNESTFELVSEKLLVVPTSIYNQVEGVLQDSDRDIKLTIKHLFGEDISSMPPIRLAGLEMDASLYRAVSSK